VTTTLLVTFVAPEASMMLNKVLMSATNTVITTMVQWLRMLLPLPLSYGDICSRNDVNQYDLQDLSINIKVYNCV
jgi:hypothetical protein